MKNRIVGIIIIGVAALIGFIILSFNMAMTDIVNTSCSHGPECAMWGTINFQTNVSLGIMAFVIVIGLYLIFFGREEKIITKIKTIRPQVELKKITKENYQKIMNNLGKDEKLVLGKIIEAEGALFQSDLVAKTGFSKVKVTRILDKLEGRQLIERKRRGMTNVIILKHVTA
ncbi:MAG: MarR family transcriptional regulator [Candidatus Aenigmarchaeota archaeon]|nr:MarR family transcriptional regulator [Candidatus Aenigmarchaeota archaeon]